MPSRVSLLSRLLLLCGTSAALPALFACLEHPLKQVEYEGEQEDQQSVEVAINKDVDILFIIDNSGSMGEEQLNLSRNFGAFLSVLEADDVRANYRIGFTTTDNGNPWCPGTGPEGGGLVLSSCRSRIQDFTFGNGATAVDRSAACLDYCPETFADIAIKPTVTQYDDVPAARFWIENIDGVTNLPDGITTSQAMSCFGPQGISGCGFESHLESMYKALRRANTENERSYGFLRDAAILAIVMVTDEADCSFNNAWVDIFSADGNRVFWSLPDEGAPTSAVCWNAGVECTGGPGTYSECHAADFNIDGQPVPPERAAADAVLHPLERYTSYVQGLEDRKRTFNPTTEVLFALIAGVPTSYPQGELTFQDAPGGTPADPRYQDNFGIGPGCTSANGEAVPPVREREFAEYFQAPDSAGNSNNIFSVCAEDFSPALRAIADKIKDQIRPACMPSCVADTEPSTPNKLDELCFLTREVSFEDGSRQSFDVPKCNDGEVVPEGEDECYVAIDVRNDPDSASPDCVADGYNLEFRVIDGQTKNIPTGIASVINATCTLSTQKALDCPDLGG